MAALRALLVVLLVGCTQGVRRFPLADPLWDDPDNHHVSCMPQEYFSGWLADGLDKSVFYPLGKVLTLPLPGEARNVNAVDEVPNSEWFTNRIGLFPMTPEELARGPCDHPPPDQGPWVITKGKREGANLGFFIRTPDGSSYLLKFDKPKQGERSNVAEVVVSRIYWAAGYHTPCNQLVTPSLETFQIDQEARVVNEDGAKVHFTREDLEVMLEFAVQVEGGRVRAVASRLLEGQPLGPFQYEGTRYDDPNDVIPHQDRRELRASRLLAAWTGHIDSREANSLDMLVTQGDRRFIRHYILDWGDSLGARWSDEEASRRLGHSYYFDPAQIGLDLITLGAWPRPWFDVEISEEAPVFGYFDAQHFRPSQWKNVYPNPAFDRMTPSDALWMVRIISRFSDDHIRALVKEARLTRALDEAYLTRILIERRDKILEEYLTQYAPLERFRLVRLQAGRPDQWLCFEDLALVHGLMRPEVVSYRMYLYGGEELDERLGWLIFYPDPAHPTRTCAKMPPALRRPADLAPGSRDDHPLRYGLAKIFIFQGAEVKPTSAVWLHLYDLGPERGFRLVGLERHDEAWTKEDI